MNKEKLFEAFPPISSDQWKEKIIADLKGADFDKKLVWKTDEGFDVQPYYRSNDLNNIPHMDVQAGSFPFVRGNKINDNNWLIRQDILVNDTAESNEKALKITKLGVDSIGFSLSDDFHPSKLRIEKLCSNLRADLVELNFKTCFPLEAINTIFTLSEKHNRDLDSIKGSIEYDPIGYFSTIGSFFNSEEVDLKVLLDLNEAAKQLPGYRYLVIDATIFNNAGAGIVSELAYALSTGADYLTYLTSSGLDIDEVASRIKFHFAVGSDYFMEIAKFRAARYLWAKIVNAYGLKDDKNALMNIHCSNSQWNKTIYDPYVNMLRTTTESMAAIIGGVDSLSVLPFNSVYETPTDFAERIARNQQLVLKGESYLDKVADISAGSYYIEELTHKLIQEAWDMFLKIDQEGGYLKAFKKGIIQSAVKKEALKKNNDIATRRRSLLGTNQYPNTSERLSPSVKLFEPQKSNVFDTEPLVIHRGADKLEALRSNTDKYSETNKRPVAWMFTYGNLAMRKARSQFAGNFFGCAGYEIVDNPGFNSVNQGIEAAKSAKPDIIVICSSDEEYAEIAETIFKSLDNQSIIVLAGYPKELVTKLEAMGLKNFVHMKSNLLEELSRYNELLKIS